MANSKANIYPIQLQGAELNLNKYDAEIKQYSGFNKNNSPFVGGCLANVFTKDETQEGSTSENTYIDTNGDVYHVDTEGLWKNEKQVIFFKGNNTFLHLTEIGSESDNTILVFYTIIGTTAKIHTLTKRYDNNSLHIYVDDIDLGVATGYYVDNKSFLEKNFHLINDEICAISTNYSSAIVVNLRLKRALTLYVYPQASLASLPYHYFYYSNYYNKLLVIAGLGVSSTIANLYQLDFENNTSTELLRRATTFTMRNETSGANALKPITNKFSDCLYDKESFAAYRVSSEVSNSDNEFYPIFLFEPDFLNSNENGIVVSGIQKNVTKITKVLTSSYLYNYQGNCVSQEKWVILPNLLLFDLHFLCYTLGTVTRDYVISYTGSVKTCGVYYDVNKVTDSGVNWILPYSVTGLWRGFVLQNRNASSKDFGLLVNNGNLSGIASSKVLLSDWNNTDIRFVSITTKHITFKMGDKWYDYQIDEYNPKLKKIGDQIVINIDSEENAYDIKRNKVLHYAPNFNGFVSIYDSSFYNNIQFPFNSSNTYEEYYLASAINEYNQQDNSSILLNPVKVSNLLGLVTDYTKRFSNSDQVNVYYGKVGEDIVYQYSTQYLDSDLKGLPFPITTDGNVLYSPSLFTEMKSAYGNKIFAKSGNTFYPLVIGNNNEPVMSFYLASGIDNLSEGFIVQGQFYGVINNGLYSLQYSNGVISSIDFIVDVSNLKFCGNTPYQAFFFSKTNRCLYSFTGANVLNQAQFLDKFEDVIGYKYNPATQTIFMITENEVIAYSAFGTYEISFANCAEIFLLQKGVCLLDDSGNFKYIRYYAENGYTKQNIILETSFYGMNNQTVTINDCLYVRLFSEEHESGDVEISASTLSNYGRTTEKTTFKIKSTDWDKMTHSIYLRYQPKEQRGLGVSFSINSPFKIAALSVGSQPDAILIDKVSKTAINAPQRTTNNSEW